MKCIIEINMNHDSFQPSWKIGLFGVLTHFCENLRDKVSGDIEDIKITDINGVTVGTAKITEEDIEHAR